MCKYNMLTKKTPRLLFIMFLKYHLLDIFNRLYQFIAYIIVIVVH